MSKLLLLLSGESGSNPVPPGDTEMITETDIVMETEDEIIMITE